MSGNRRRTGRVQGYAWTLLILTGLFGFRVGAQLIQVWHPVAFFPSFDAWQSGALPYQLLLLFQVGILGICLRIVYRMFKGAVVPVQKKGKNLLYLGGLYLSVMGIRLLIGLTVAPDHFWFGAVLPTVFHFVLAAFMLVYGQYHVSGACPSKFIPHEAKV